MCCYIIDSLLCPVAHPNEWISRSCVIGKYRSDHLHTYTHTDILVIELVLLQPSATRKYGRHINTCVKILDMTGLKLSALNQIKVPSDDILCYVTSIWWYYYSNRFLQLSSIKALSFVFDILKIKTLSYLTIHIWFYYLYHHSK